MTGYFPVDARLLFFFFKQKTAYEMRISDWSSDVCSSDLVLAIAFDLWRGLRRFATTARGVAERRIEGRFAQRNRLPELEPVAEAFDRKIGRASWRERVCQYV